MTPDQLKQSEYRRSRIEWGCRLEEERGVDPEAKAGRGRIRSYHEIAEEEGYAEDTTR